MVDHDVHARQIHDVLEKEHLYPLSTQVDEGLVRHALEEHEGVNKLIEEIKETEPDDERMDGLMETLISEVKDHVKEEEKDLFPKLQKTFDKETFKDMGKKMAELKQTFGLTDEDLNLSLGPIRTLE